MRKKSGKMESNLQPLPWQGNALPLSYFRKTKKYRVFENYLINSFSDLKCFTLLYKNI